jgi:hypothetical protein
MGYLKGGRSGQEPSRRSPWLRGEASTVPYRRRRILRWASGKEKEWAAGLIQQEKGRSLSSTKTFYFKFLFDIR